MIKAELIEKLAAENTHLTHAEVERVVNIVLGRMTEAMADGGRVELRGFGAFSVRSRPARAGRNPRTGETVDVLVNGKLIARGEVVDAGGQYAVRIVEVASPAAGGGP